jgi:hypothetical protein
MPKITKIETFVVNFDNDEWGALVGLYENLEVLMRDGNQFPELSQEDYQRLLDSLSDALTALTVG